MNSRALIKAVRQGSGKAYFLVKEDPDGASKVLSRFLDEPISIDIQSNGTHAAYLYELLSLCPNLKEFEQRLAQQKRFSLRAMDLFTHRIELMGQFVRHGSLSVNDRLVRLYRWFVKRIYVNKDDLPINFFGFFEDVLFALCVDEDVFMRVLKDMFVLLDEERIDYSDIDWFLTSYCMDYADALGDEPLFRRAYKLCRKDIALIERAQEKGAAKRPTKAKKLSVSLDELSEGEIYAALPIFIEGAMERDSPTILRYLKRLDYNYERDLAHPAILAVTHNKHLTKEVYRYVYERSYCSSCRAKLFFIMQENGYLDQQTVLAATHDCEEEVAETAAKILKTSQN